MKKLLLIPILFLFFSLTASAQMLLFAEKGCPFCENLNTYLQQNDLYAKLEITSLDVTDPANKKLYQEKTNALGYYDHEIPLLISGSEYRVGDTNIIDYLKNLEKPTTTPENSNLSQSQINELKGLITGKQNNKSTILVYGLAIALVLGLILKLFSRR